MIRFEKRGMEDIMNLEMWRKFQPESDGIDTINDAERPQLHVIQLSARSSSIDMAT